MNKFLFLSILFVLVSFTFSFSLTQLPKLQMSRIGSKSQNLMKISGGKVSKTKNTKVILGTEKMYSELVKKSHSSLVVLDFSASWCAPCKKISPIYDNLSNQYADVTFVKFDVDEFPSIAQQNDVSSMPTFLFMKNGQVIDRFSGANPSQLEEYILKHS